MISEINFLLVGNSRLHWAQNFYNEYKFFHTNKEEKAPKNIDLNNLIWASVGNKPNFFLPEKNEIKTKDIKLSNLPYYFGVDRALATLAALETIQNPLKKNLLIADCGTILSLTKVTKEGLIIGGQLAPGFLSQLKSIDKYTKNLKIPKSLEIPSEDFPINTEDAILKGVINSLIGLINISFNPLEDILITCGGDSKIISRILKINNTKFINMPNLVMKGMLIHYQASKKLCQS